MVHRVMLCWRAVQQPLIAELLAGSQCCAKQLPQLAGLTACTPRSGSGILMNDAYILSAAGCFFLFCRKISPKWRGVAKRPSLTLPGKEMLKVDVDNSQRELSGVLLRGWEWRWMAACCCCVDGSARRL